jgi:hypothetical protein
MCTWQTTTAPYKPATKLLTILHKQWGQQMTPTSTKTKPTTTTTTESATIMSITKMSTTVAITTTNATVETKFSQANFNYITIYWS